jgi:putative inorganic carbon (HCO3(-)) transporter
MSASSRQPTAQLLQQLIVGSFHFLLIVTPFIFTWVNEELFEFNKMLLTYAVTIVIVGAWICRMIIERTWLIKRTPLDWAMGAFVLSQVLSTVFSIHPRTSLFGYYTRFNGGLLSTLSYVLLYYAMISTLKRRHLPWLLVSAFVAAAGVALYAIPEHFGHSPSCALITGGQDFGVSCWVQDVKSRVFATFGQPNWLAAYAVTLFPVGLAFLSQVRHVKQTTKQTSPFNLTAFNGFMAVTLVGLFLTILFTKSRSGILALGVSMGMFGLGYLWLQIKTLKRPSFAGLNTLLTQEKWLLSTVGACLAAALIFGTPYSPSFTQSLYRSTTQQMTPPSPAPAANRLETGGTESGEIRRIVWKGALKVWQRYPLLGSGVETFAYSYYQDRPVEHNLVSEWDFLYNKAHNEFLNFLATTGLVGLVTYLAVLGGMSWLGLTLLLNSNSPTHERLLSWALVSGLGALSVSNFFGFSTVMVSILLFLYAAWIVMLQPTQSAAEQEVDQPSSGVSASPALELDQFLLLGLTALVSSYLLIQTWQVWRADFSYTVGKGTLQTDDLRTGLALLHQAAQLSPSEGLFFEELGSTYAALAVGIAGTGDASSAAELSQTSLIYADQALKLNPRHLNFYKTKARVLITLAQIEPGLLEQATTTLQEGLTLAPTDAKLMYNLGIVQLALGQTALAQSTLEQTLVMKPNYDIARVKLGEVYTTQGNLEAAKEQYQRILESSPNNQPVQELLQAVEASLSARPQP